MDADSAFVVVGLPAGAGAEPLLDLWAPALDAGGHSFAPGEAPAGGLSWQVNLPADSAAAEATLQSAERRLRLAEEAIPAAVRRLDDLAISLQQGPSFSVSAMIDPAGDTPEGELVSLLTTGEAPPRPAAFGVVDDIRHGWGEVTDWFASIVETVLAPLAKLATVETRIEGHSLARTGVGWTGDFATACQTGLAEEVAALHGRAVKLALASRLALAKVFALALRGAALIAVACSSPGGAVVALPAVWRFITRVQAEYAAIREGVTGGQ